jgi:hypothetical protein
MARFQMISLGYDDASNSTLTSTVCDLATTLSARLCRHQQYSLEHPHSAHSKSIGHIYRHIAMYFLSCKTLHRKECTSAVPPHPSRCARLSNPVCHLTHSAVWIPSMLLIMVFIYDTPVQNCALYQIHVLHSRRT